MTDVYKPQKPNTLPLDLVVLHNKRKYTVPNSDEHGPCLRGYTDDACYVEAHEAGADDKKVAVDYKQVVVLRAHSSLVGPPPRSRAAGKRLFLFFRYADSPTVLRPMCKPQRDQVRSQLRVVGTTSRLLQMLDEWDTVGSVGRETLDPATQDPAWLLQPRPPTKRSRAPAASRRPAAPQPMVAVSPVDAEDCPPAVLLPATADDRRLFLMRELARSELCQPAMFIDDLVKMTAGCTTTTLQQQVGPYVASRLTIGLAAWDAVGRAGVFDDCVQFAHQPGSQLQLRAVGEGHVTPTPRPFCDGSALTTKLRMQEINQQLERLGDSAASLELHVSGCELELLDRLVWCHESCVLYALCKHALCAARRYTAPATSAPRARMHSNLLLDALACFDTWYFVEHATVPMAVSATDAAGAAVTDSDDEFEDELHAVLEHAKDEGAAPAAATAPVSAPATPDRVVCASATTRDACCDVPALVDGPEANTCGPRSVAAASSPGAAVAAAVDAAGGRPASCARTESSRKRSHPRTTAPDGPPVVAPALRATALPAALTVQLPSGWAGTSFGISCAGMTLTVSAGTNSLRIEHVPVA